MLVSGYFIYNKLTNTSTENRYLTTKVEKGTIAESVSGTGQVDDVNQIELKAKVSGDVIYIGAKNGQRVTTGTLIVKIDPKDAEGSVRDAETNLASAKLALKKLQIQNSDENLNADVLKAYDDAFDIISATFSDLNSTITNLNNMLNKNILSDNAAAMSGNREKYLKDKANNSYYTAEKYFKTVEEKYILLNNKSSHTEIKNILDETYSTTKLLSEAIKDSSDFVNLMASNSEDASSFTSDQNTLTTYSNTINTDLSEILATKTAIKNNEDTSQSGNIDIESAQISVQQKENSLQDAKDKLADYFIRAPFDGVIANLDLKKSDSINSGGSVASIVTTKQLAVLSFNEVDIAKIKIDQKAVLTFDAIPDLSITGQVSEVDPIGTVEQGVVNYTVKVSLDTQDARIKSGMTVNANIQTEVKQNVLHVPSSAVKNQNGKSYVQVFSTPLIDNGNNQGTASLVKPKQVEVQTGISDDINIEIISGLTEGEQIVTKTISSGSTPQPGATTNNPRAGGANVIRF